MPLKVSTEQPLKHYKWGDDCDGWTLVDASGLSVKQERMPAGTSEQLHYHQAAQQFFYILQGTATFEVDGETMEVGSGEGLHIQPGSRHRIMNRSEEALLFILSSQPSTAADRINL